MSAIETADRFSSVAHEMGRWLDRVLGPEFHQYRPRQAWSPSINLYEDADAYYLVADMAGIEPDAIDLRVEKRQLLLGGERPAPRPPAGRLGPRGEGACVRLHVMEIDHGPFLRALDLPDHVDADAIQACYSHGFLWVKLPKADPPGRKG